MPDVEQQDREGRRKEQRAEARRDHRAPEIFDGELKEGEPESGNDKAAEIVIQFIAETSPERGKLRKRIRRPTGVIIAPPNPCTTRISRSIGRLVENPQSADPVAKIAIAAQNTTRAPSRSAIQPPNGIKTARLSR